MSIPRPAVRLQFLIDGLLTLYGTGKTASWRKSHIFCQESKLQHHWGGLVWFVRPLREHPTNSYRKWTKDEGNSVCCLWRRHGSESSKFNLLRFTVPICISQAKNALDHLNGFHLQERYIVVLYHMPAKQDAAAAKADLARREEELAQLKKKHNIGDDWFHGMFLVIMLLFPIWHAL